jgi:hypothetical protein
MVIIVVHVGKNMAYDVLSDGDSKVNVIMNGLKWKLGLLPHQPTLFNLKMEIFSYNKLLGIVPTSNNPKWWLVIYFWKE